MTSIQHAGCSQAVVGWRAHRHSVHFLSAFPHLRCACTSFIAHIIRRHLSGAIPYAAPMHRLCMDIGAGFSCCLTMILPSLILPSADTRGFSLLPDKPSADTHAGTVLILVRMLTPQGHAPIGIGPGVLF